MSAHYHQEPPFVGESRRDLVARLMDLFDDINAGHGSIWVSLEAPSGWGKSRIVREFYKRLSQERQFAHPAYWPTDMLHATAQQTEDVGYLRKRTYPERVPRAAGAVPEWFWWGINCSTTHGVSTGLGDALAQLDAHSPWLRIRALQLSNLAERFREDIDEWKKKLAEEGAKEAVDRIISTAIGEIPGFGWVWKVARWAGRRGLAEYSDARTRRTESLIAPGISSLAQDAADSLVDLAQPGLPVVIFVEDLHEGSLDLANTLADVLQRSRSTLIITTSLPGQLDTNPQMTPLVKPTLRRVTFSNKDTPSGPSLCDLTPRDLAQVVAFYMPNLAKNNVTALIKRYGSNVLALQLSIQLLCARLGSDVREVETRHLESLPGRIEDLYRELWRELPQPVRRALVLATWATPASIAPDLEEYPWLADRRWNDPVLVEVIARAIHQDANELSAALRDASDIYAWVRQVEGSDVLRMMREPALFDVVSDDPTDDWFGSDVRDTLYQVLAEACVRSTEAGDPHHASLVIALHNAGFIGDSPIVVDAYLVAIEELYPQARTRERIAVASKTALNIAKRIGLALDSALGLSLRAHYAMATSTAHWAEVDWKVGRLWSDILRDRARVLKEQPDNPAVRSPVVEHWVSSARRGIAEFRSIDPSSVTDNEIALCLAELGQPEAELEEYVGLLEWTLSWGPGYDSDVEIAREEVLDALRNVHPDLIEECLRNIHQVDPNFPVPPDIQRYLEA